MADDRITTTITYDLLLADRAGEDRSIFEVLPSLGITFTGWRTGPVAHLVEIFGVDPLSIPEPPPVYLRVHPRIPLRDEPVYFSGKLYTGEPEFEAE